MDPHSMTFAALCALALILGVKHGFDADHLATIDGLARCNAARSPRTAKFSGALFSSGHGLVVVLVTLLVASNRSASGPVFTHLFKQMQVSQPVRMPNPSGC